MHELHILTSTCFLYFYVMRYDFIQATKYYLFLAKLYTYRQPNNNSLHPHSLSVGVSWFPDASQAPLIDEPNVPYMKSSAPVAKLGEGFNGWRWSGIPRYMTVDVQESGCRNGEHC